MTPHSSGSPWGSNAGTDPAFSYSAALCTSSVASPPSSTICVGPPPSGQSRASRVHHQYSSSVSPFHANTGMPLGLGRRPAGLGPAHDDGRGGVVLGREDVARRPADVGAEVGQRLDEDGRLDRHVQAAHDAHASQRLLAGVPLTDGHQAGHLLLGEADFLPAPFGQAEVRHLERRTAGLLRRLVRVLALDCHAHSCLSLTPARSPERRASGRSSPLRYPLIVLLPAGRLQRGQRRPRTLTMFRALRSPRPAASAAGSTPSEASSRSSRATRLSKR